MRSKARRALTVALAAAMSMTLFGGTNLTLPVSAKTADTQATQLTDEDVKSLVEDVDVDRTSVHDPSVVDDGNGTYYVFGSHMGVSKTTDLENWTSVTSESTTSTLFGTEDANGNVTVTPYTDAFKSNAYTGKVTILDSKGDKVQADFGDNYDIASWISSNTVSGNMWAPDVIYNKSMGKWCMYLSLNGAKWNSAIILLTASDIEGPYVYQGPIVFSGFSTAGSGKDYNNTDLELVIGQQDELPAKYQKISDGSWGTYWPHAIDPAVYYDEDGNLWMTYGSWSGGIYELQLDEKTGLRDYTVQYADTYDTLGASCTSDPYFGTKIAGGYYVSGEGSYIEHIGDYYYLFISYGFYSPEGGYNMRVFRSKTPDGSYTDEDGNSAIYSKYIMNYSATDTANDRGEKIMGGYQWDTMTKGEISQGHNSVLTTKDGKSFLVYHTKFNDNTASHEVRVHQLFTNEDGWLVAAPYEYSGETLSDTGYAAEDIVGSYGLITHKFQTAYSTLECQKAENITLNADGTITGTYTGTWTEKDGTAYANLTIDGTEYKGVFTEQGLDGTNINVMCFTAVSKDGLCIWGSHALTDDVAVAKDATSGEIAIPSVTTTDLDLVTSATYGSSVTYTSSNTDILSNDGKVTAADEATKVTLTARIAKGDYYYEKEYTVTVQPSEQNSTDSLVVGKYFTDEEQDLSKCSDGTLSVPNPFYKGNYNGLDLTGGATVEFDVKTTGTVNVLGTLFAFQADKGGSGRLYFTPGSYLGYNAGGAYYDANLKSYALVKDYIGDSAHVAVTFTQTGFSVKVNGETAYTQDILSTENGAGTVKNYNDVLDWLSSKADTLYFGYGSWWTDKANATISNVVCSVGPTTDKVTTKYNNVTYTKDKMEITSDDFYETEANPFKGENIKNFTAEYTINMTSGTAQNGWDGIFAFYNSTSTGRVSFQTNPYICYNDASGNWMDINQPGAGGDDVAKTMTPGTAYKVKEVITADGITITVDGKEISLGKNSSGATYQKLMECLTSGDLLTWGVGKAKSSYWNTEKCTLTDVSFEINDPDISSGTDDDDKKSDSELNGTGNQVTEADGTVTLSKDKVVLTSTDSYTQIDNPFYGKEFDSLTLSYKINMTSGTAQNGWDGIFSFFSGESGRIPVETAPYICYNDASGNWIDFNQPGAGGTNAATSMTAGTEVPVEIAITADKITVTVNGSEITTAQNGSGASYTDLLSYIAKCPYLTWGVGTAKSAYWNTELCTLTDVNFTASAAKKEEKKPTASEAGVLVAGMKYSVAVDNAADYESSDTSIAKVNEHGVVTAKATGSVTITTTFEDGTTSEKELKVEVPSADKYTKVELTAGETYQIAFDDLTVRPDSYETRKDSVATVDENGLITAAGQGTTIVTAYFGTGDDAAEYKFSVHVSE